MAENGGGGGDSLPEELGCRRSDGKKWRCRRLVMPGKTMCEAHYLQGRLRQKKEPVPENLKLDRERSTKKNPKFEENPNQILEIRAKGDVGSLNLPPLRVKKFQKIEENPTQNLEIRANGDVGSLNLPQKRGKKIQKIEENSTQNLEIRANVDVGCLIMPQKRGKRKIRDGFSEDNLKIRSLPQKGDKKNKIDDNSLIEMSEKLDDVLRKMKLKKGDMQLELIRGCLKREIEKKKAKQLKKKDVKVLKYGTMEIPHASPSSAAVKVNNRGHSKVKVGGSASSSVARSFRSKNIEPIPIATEQVIPGIYETIKAARKKKRKKCHWCRKGSSYRVYVNCLTCKKHSFCEDCIRERHHEKAEIKKECPVCNGTCRCRACTRERSKKIKTKDSVVCNGEKKFDRIQQRLYVIDLLLPLLEQINQEKIIELEMEAKVKGKTHSQLQIPLAIDTQMQQCCNFCTTCMVDVHRSCGNCSYILCLLCCQEFREGNLNESLRDLKIISKDQRKYLCASWKMSENGSIKCPPKHLGGCGNGILDLKSQTPFSWTKDLEATAKQIVSIFKFTKPFKDSSSSFCSLCEGNNDIESQEEGKVTILNLDDENLEHFMKHWVKGQPLVIRDVVKSRTMSAANWDPVSMFCTYLKRSGMSEKDKGSDCFELEMGQKQVSMGGKMGEMRENVWHEVLKFKVWVSWGFFQEQFPCHYDAVRDALPFPEYINPLTFESQNPNLSPFVYISYGGPEELIQADFSSKLCYHAYDVVDLLAHATKRPISQKNVDKLKNLMSKYNSQDHHESSKKIKIRNAIGDLFGKSSFSSELTQHSGSENDTNEELAHTLNGEMCVISNDLSILGDSNDEDFFPYNIGSSSFHGEKLFVDKCGAQWDIFRRQDVPKLVEYLNKYSDVLNQSYGCPEKVVHPILDECFYLDAFHKMKLKEEFDIEPFTFEQNIGEAVIIPAGCPYQIKKIKACVNVVLGFISPESASNCVKLSDELRQLPLYHKAKTKMPEVKKMTTYSINAAIEEIRNVTQADFSWTVLPFLNALL